MSLSILAGRAGSGKTHACIAQIRAELHSAPIGAPLVWLVPERATLSAERSLYDAQLTGSARAQVLGLHRFARLVLREPAPPGAIAQGVLLAEVLQEDPAAFGPFAALADHPGFLRTLLLTLEELAAYGLDRPTTGEAALPERL
ncbi:MAG TPA: hypothetical protein VFK80_07250, partial [Limnochordia bacterium]|nr:hypothetical protein [Limnochordia bacterium]